MVVGLREETLSWSNYVTHYDDAVLSWKESGKENTHLILSKTRENKEHAPAAEWCAMYDYDGVQSGDAFLPSQSEWLKVCTNLGGIQEPLRAFGKPLGGLYWTSTEAKHYPEAVAVIPHNGRCSSVDKFYEKLVRCFFAF